MFCKVLEGVVRSPYSELQDYIKRMGNQLVVVKPILNGLAKPNGGVRFACYVWQSCD